MHIKIIGCLIFIYLNCNMCLRIHRNSKIFQFHLLATTEKPLDSITDRVEKDYGAEAPPPTRGRRRSRREAGGVAGAAYYQ